MRMRTQEEIERRFSEVNAWRQWQLTAQLAGDANLEDMLQPGPPPIPEYLSSDDSMAVPGIVRALAWALGAEWEDAYMGG